MRPPPVLRASRKRQPTRWQREASALRWYVFLRRSMAKAITALFRVSLEFARENGVSAYVGDGLNRWPAVHRLDAALLYRLVLEKGAAGARYHAVADEGVPIRDIANVIGRQLNLPVVAKSREEAAAHFGWLAPFLGMDGPASSAQTREQLGWRPVQPALIPDVDSAHYFEPEQTAYASPSRR